MSHKRLPMCEWRLSVVAVCTMCYLGFARMETALKALGVQTDDVEYTPFLIRPSLSEDDTVDRAVLAQLKNGKEQADELFCELNEEAREFGICL